MGAGSDDNVQVAFTASIDALISGLNGASDALVKSFGELETKVNDTSRAIEEKLGGAANSAGDKLKKTHEESLNVGHALEDLKGKLNTAFEATGIAIAWELMKKVVEQIEKIADNAERVLQTALSFRATTVELQGLEAIAVRSGGSVDLLRRAMAQLTNIMTSAAEGSEQAQMKLADVGITLDDVRNPAFSVIDAMVKISQSGASNAEVLSLLGNRMVGLLPTLRELSGGLDTVHHAAAEVGALNKEQLEVLEHYKQKVETLSLKWENFKSLLLIGVVPAMEKIIDVGTESAQKVGEAWTSPGAEKIFSQWRGQLTWLIDAFKTIGSVAADPLKLVGLGRASSDTSSARTGAPGGHGAIGARPEERPPGGDAPKHHETEAEAAARLARELKAIASEQDQTTRTQIQRQIALNEDYLTQFSRIQQVALERKRDSSLAQVELETESLKQQLRMGEISAEEYARQERTLVDRKLMIQTGYYEQVKALVAQHQADVDKADADIERAAAAHGKAMQRNQEELAMGIQRRWMEILQPISMAFDESIKGMIRGTLTFQHAMRNMGQSIVLEFVSACVKLLTKWVATEIAKTQATVVGSAVRQSAEQAGHKQGLAASAASAIKEIANSAYVTMANVYRSVSAIPYVGWILAPIAAIAAGAAVLAFGGSIASAAGGWEVPKDQMAQLHKDEMVLPANLAQGFKSMITGGGSPGGGGGNQFHTHYHVAAMDAGGVKKFLRKHGAEHAAALSEQARRFNPALRLGVT